MPWISNKFLLSLCYVNMLLGHTRVINKYVNIKCSLFLEIKETWLLSVFIPRITMVFTPYVTINITIQSNFGAQYADYIKPALCTNFPRVLFKSLDLQKREGIWQACYKVRMRGFFLLKHFIWFLIYFLNCFILCIFNETIFTLSK